MKVRLEGDVDEKDDSYEEIAGVEDHVVPETGLELPPRCELSSLREGLHEREDQPGEELRGPVNDPPEVVQHTAGHVGVRLRAVLPATGPPAPE